MSTSVQLQLEFNHKGRVTSLRVKTPQPGKGKRLKWKNKQAPPPVVTRAKVTPAQDFLRARIRQQVGVLSCARNISFHEAWILSYHRLFERTGFHAVTESARRGLKTHLDAVFQAQSHVPQILLASASELLRETKIPQNANANATAKRKG
jgi:hypothetical protein